MWIQAEFVLCQMLNSVKDLKIVEKPFLLTFEIFVLNQ